MVEAVPRRRRTPISVKLISLLIVVLLLIMTAIGAFLFITERRSLYGEFEERNRERMERLAFVLRDPLWYVDDASMEKLVDFEMADRDVLSVTVIGDDGETVLLSKRRAGDTVEVVTRDETQPEGGAPVFTTAKAEVKKDDAVLGSVVMEITNASIRKETTAIISRLAAELFILTAVLTLVLFFSIRRLVIRKIRLIGKFISRIGEGDLTGELSIVSGDEMEELSEGLSRFLSSLKTMLAQLKVISTGNTEKGDEIAVSMEEVTSTMEEIDAMMRQIMAKSAKLDLDIAGSAGAADEIKEDLKTLSDRIAGQYESMTASVAEVRRMISAVNTVADSTGSRIRVLRDLTSRTEAGGREMQKMKIAMEAITRSVGLVSGILEVIDDVAARSNLLAMNAAIEAAHAGAAGKGFAVVAGEIRKLSVTTSENAKKVAATVREITAGIRETETVTETAGTLIGDILSDIRGISENFSELLDSVNVISREGEEVGRKLSTVISLSDEVKSCVSSIGMKSDTIRSSMDQVKGLAEGTMLSVNEITTGITGAASSMEVLTALGVRNSETTKTIDAELAKFKTE